MVPYFNGSSEVFITRDLISGDLYELEAVLLTAGEAGIPELLVACNNGSDSRYGQMREIYTKLPNHL